MHRTTLLCAVALSPLAASCNDIGVLDLPAQPEASLEGDESAYRGQVVTVHGKVTDNSRQYSADETTALWQFYAAGGADLDLVALNLQADCSTPPAPSASSNWGEVDCTFTTPTDVAAMTVKLTAQVGGRESEPARLDITLDAGASPTCSLAAPAAIAPDGAYFADRSILIDGACADATGETSPAGLYLWFRDTYENTHGTVVTEVYAAAADTGDTGGTSLVFDAGSSEARLYGEVTFEPADEHQLCLFAEDESGNTNGNDTCVTFEVLPPNQAPWCTILEPADGTTGAVGAPVQFQALVGDPDQDPSTLYVEWTSDQLASPIGYGTPTPEGFLGLTSSVVFDTTAAHVITLRVVDQWEAPGTCEVDYNVANGPSVSVWVDDLDYLFDFRQSTPFVCEYSDTDTACADMTIEWELFDSDGSIRSWGEAAPTTPGSTQPCTETFIYDPGVEGALEEGSYYMRCWVTDEEGARNSAAAYFEIEDCIQTYYQDLDADGYGDSTITMEDCTQPTGYAAIAGDCDDSNVSINPGAVELCNALDDNCDGNIDEGFHLVPFYRDADGDGYGDDADPYPDLVCSGATLSGYVTLGGDCDDTQPDINPGEPEQCDETDHDCDGDIDNGFPYPFGTIQCYDGDADGFGSTEVMSCEALTGHTTVCDDCDDTNAAINPAGVEVCNTTTPVDEDCDGVADPIGAPSCVTRYLDADGDGYGTDLGTSACVCLDNTYGYTSTNAGDCDDGAYSVNPGEVEVCDAAGTDEDCDGYTETEDAAGCSDYYYDADGDDYYATGAASRCLCAPDGDYRGHLPGDCDDHDATLNPSAAEVCDGDDNDCDGLIDDDDGSASGQTPWYRDADTDGYGLATVTLDRCDQPSGYVADDTDCDDTSSAIHPGGIEICDGANADEDCDGLADDADPSATGQSTWYYDADSDTYGISSSTLSRCDQPTGYVSRGADCDDGDASINPGATEICDASDTDEDCNGSADDADSSATGQSTWFRDADSDTYGTSATTLSRCNQPTGYVADSADCDDTDAAINPAAAEICDSSDIDEDCDGAADDSDSSATGQSTWYLDADSDTYGTSSTTLSRCNQPSGYVSRGSDCNDGNASINPGATEVCDAYDTDENCNGVADDSDSTVSSSTKSTWYRDADSDTYGTSTTTLSRCNQPTGYASRGSDCNDANSAINPGATEVCDASDTDENCNGVADDSDSTVSSSTQSTWYRDADDDNYGTSTTTLSRCNQPTGYVSNNTDCDDSWDLRNPELAMYQLVEVYSSSRHDHMTTKAGSGEYISVTSSGLYTDASPLVVGYSVATFPAKFIADGKTADYDQLNRGWSSGCSDHVTCIDVATVNADSAYSHGCTYADDGLSLGYLPSTDQGSYTNHWNRCWKTSWNNHRMSYPTSSSSTNYSCDALTASGYVHEHSVHWIFNQDISCP
ncbi:MAG: MopE-related protein [Pseudomonadota bacterium]